jgi:alanine dehydrogenase
MNYRRPIRIRTKAQSVIILTNDDVAPFLTMPDCMASIEAAFRDFGNDDAVDIPRQDAVVPNPREGAVHDLKTMSGSWPAAGIAAVRINSDIVTAPVVNGAVRRVKLHVSPPDGRYNGWALLFSTDTGQLLAMISDGLIQRARVAATSGVAAKYLARAEAKVLGLLGTGFQAGGQIEAMCAARGFERVKVYSPTPENRRRFAEHYRRVLDIPVDAVASADEAADGVDVLVTATNSASVTVKPDWLKPGLHLSTINRCEVPPAAVKKVDRLVLNAREGGKAFIARNSAVMSGIDRGDPAKHLGVADLTALPELRDMVSGRFPGRQSDTEITCFHNYQGLGLQFAAIGKTVYGEAVKRGLGLAVDDSYLTQTVHP